MTLLKVFAQYLRHHKRPVASGDPLAGSWNRCWRSWGRDRWRVLDAGGGEGQTAIKVAQLGPSRDAVRSLRCEMVARARQAAADKGVIDNMHFCTNARLRILRSIWKAR